MNYRLDSSSRRLQQALSFSGFTAVAAVVAAAAAGLSAALALPVWAMFIGWVAFFTRGISVREGIANAVSVALGLAVGMAAALALGVLGPLLGALALPLVVFVVAVVIVSLRAAPVLNNILCYFLGLIAYFASHLPPSIAAFTELGSATVLGSLAAWIAHYLQQRMRSAA